MCAYVCLSVFKSTVWVWDPMEVVRDIGSLQTGVTDGCELLSGAGNWTPVLGKNSGKCWKLCRTPHRLMSKHTICTLHLMISLYSTCLKYEDFFLSDIFIGRPTVTGIWPNFLHTLSVCLWKVKIFYNSRSLWMSKKRSVFRLSSVSLTKSRKCIKVK